MLCLRTVLFFGAGVMVGAGLLLYGQVRFGLYIHDEVENTFFLWRKIGEVTYFLQTPQTSWRSRSTRSTSRCSWRVGAWASP